MERYSVACDIARLSPGGLMDAQLIERADASRSHPAPLPAHSAPGVELRLLGGFALRHDGEPVTLQPAAQKLLALLALRDRPMPRSLVAATLWPDTLDERAAANLRSTLWRLRRAPMPLVLSRGQQLELDPGVTVDTRQLEHRAQALLERSAPAANSDVELFDGALLPEWWEDWVLHARERLRQISVHALEQLSRRLQRDGRWVEALTAALAAVAAEPLRESAHRLVIEVHLAQANPGAALHQYQEYRTLLDTELGLAPSHVMEDVIAGVLR